MYVQMTWYEVRKSYEYFFTKPMPEKMPYKTALEILLRDIGADRLLGYVRTIKEKEIEGHVGVDLS